VQAAGDAVHLPLELHSAVHSREDDLDARNAVLWMDVDRDPTTVVGNRHRSVRIQSDLDLLAKARHRFVDRVVDDLVDEVVKAPRVNAPDVHRGPLPDRLQALQDLDLLGVIGGLFYHLNCNLPEIVSMPSLSPSRRMFSGCHGVL